MRKLALAAFGLMAFLLQPALAYAQAASMPTEADAAQSPRVQLYLTPYLWVSGVSGTTSTSNLNIPSQTATASFGDILSHLNGIPVMGAAELRYDRLGLLTDLIGISLASNVATNGPLFSGGTVKLRELLSTVMPTYRVVDIQGQTLDLGVGVRVVAYWATLSFNAGLLPGFSRSPSLSWADPLAGARYHLDLPNHFGLTAYGDVGGASGNNLTWQLLGTIDYQFNDWIVLHAGYRHLHIDYDGNVLHTSTALSGPIFGTTFRF